MASLNTTYNTNKGINKQTNNELKEINNAYSTDGYQKLTDSLINATNDYAKTQTNIQNQQTEQAIKEINQNKEYQRQDYLKEQKGAYTDYQEQSDKFANEGTNFRHSGVSETAQTRLYTAYQNRVATARESYNRAITNYDNQITNARLQNNAKLADIAFQALQSKLQLSIESFQYMQEMNINRVNARISARDRQYNRWADKETRKEQKKYYKSFSSGSGGCSSSYSYGSSSKSSSSSGGGTIKKTKNKNNKSSGWSTDLTKVVNSKGYPAGTNINNLKKAGLLQTKTVNGKTYYK